MDKPLNSSNFIKIDSSPAPILSSKQIDICKLLDDYYLKNVENPIICKPSNIFVGALYLMQSNFRNNPDWISQSAHSLRELLYPIMKGSEGKDKVSKISNRFENSGCIYFKSIYIKLYELYCILSDIAHHGLEPHSKYFKKNNISEFNEREFERIVLEYEDMIFYAFVINLKILERIESILSKTPNEYDDQEKLKDEIELINSEDASREYFYYKLNEKWFEWIQRQGCLKVLSQRDVGLVKMNAVLDYILRMVNEKPAGVAEVILSTTVSIENNNTAVINYFLRICSLLPADYLSRLVQKIKEEKWIPLVKYNRWDFEFKDMFQTLKIAKDSKSILILAEAVLAIKTKEEIEKGRKQSMLESPFYFEDMSDTEVFLQLLDVTTEYKETALALTSRVLGEIISISGENTRKGSFLLEESNYFFDVDFFTLELENNERISHWSDVKNLAAVIRMLYQQIFADKSERIEEINSIYKKHIESLPDNRDMWRFKLSIMSLFPEAFRKELKDSFFRLFEVDKFYEITLGTEYKKALKKCFNILSEKDREDYIMKIIEYFGVNSNDEQEKKELLREGSNILAMISKYVEDNQDIKREVAKYGFVINTDYKPHPMIGKVQGGIVQPREPEPIEKFNKKNISELIYKLKNEWRPIELKKKNKFDDFLTPLNAESIANMMKKDFSLRPQKYLNNANLFYDKDVIDQHYTYSFLIAVQDCLENKRETLENLNWENLFGLLDNIKGEGERKPFNYEKRDREFYSGWLAGWDSVHLAMAGVIQELLQDRGGITIIDFEKYRNDILSIVKYLLNQPDPEPKDEQIETAVMKMKAPDDYDYFVSDPYTIAINSIRGRGFENLVLFINQDGKRFHQTSANRIANDVKDIYLQVLNNENTRAIMFMLGHHLPSLFFRDEEWIKSLLSLVFPVESAKKYLYTASWEGYLANNLYKDMFFEPEIQKLYYRALESEKIDYPNQKHFRDPEEGLGTHIALAYIHYDEFDIKNDLITGLFANKRNNIISNMIDFIGRTYISGKNPDTLELLNKNPQIKIKLTELWDYTLDNCNNYQVFTAFGFWIDIDKSIFDPLWLVQHVKESLERTNGILNWEIGLLNSIVSFAKISPSDSLSIIRFYLLEGIAKRSKEGIWLRGNDEWKEALSILYKKKETKDETYRLIIDLIRFGGRAFWDFEKIVTVNES